MGKSFEHKLLNLDIFGYPVSLYYHKHQRKKKSMCGLILSVMMLMTAALYIGILALRVGNP